MKARDLINILSYRPDAEIKIVPHHPDYTKENFSDTENFAKIKEYHKTKNSHYKIFHFTPIDFRNCSLATLYLKTL